ncbi:lipid-binding SYLF domain-containing protein [Zeaxanthinibacter sp. PT1]|uniref:lipid-binding SYLF domain-containing protein n=1 Tax=Zeaxanthinibacter TaxID=561554 RepID=UPI00234B41DA|nr:lipid-binding SYLF domain-containing protein [Zeaxanthinibacter sp. PT1]MDC6351057.1 lipid-binding SYLF domain-containing protein [Zeaxanthinibacter sp. PT1]
MQQIKNIIVIIALLIGAIGLAQSDKNAELMKDVEKAKQTLLTTSPDIQSYFDNSAGYVIFPNVGKGGFIVGGAAGNGIVFENGQAVGVANLKKVTVGLQAGGAAIIEAIFFETQEDLDSFKEEDFEFSAGVSAVALKSGKSYSAKYDEGVKVFTYSKAGLMADASVGGQRFDYHDLGEAAKDDDDDDDDYRK